MIQIERFANLKEGTILYSGDTVDDESLDSPMWWVRDYNGLIANQEYVITSKEIELDPGSPPSLIVSLLNVSSGKTTEINLNLEEATQEELGEQDEGELPFDMLPFNLKDSRDSRPTASAANR